MSNDTITVTHFQQCTRFQIWKVYVWKSDPVKRRVKPENEFGGMKDAGKHSFPICASQENALVTVATHRKLNDKEE